MLSCRRETVLQGALVLAKSRRQDRTGRQYFTDIRSIFNHCDIIGLQSYKIL